MNREVTINITGSSSTEEGIFEEISVSEKGVYKHQGGMNYISYYETDEETKEVIHNLIKLDGSHMEHTKRGMTDTVLRFEEEKEHETVYRTPYGELIMKVKTYKYEFENDRDAICANIEYELYLNGSSFGTRNIMIEIK
ncbi:MAG: DUF1934 domain-containing protein [Lachnospiraceae bacterium]|nr:DUF1934 domain-containing protein [Lachnospiraceae bacterium]